MVSVTFRRVRDRIAERSSLDVGRGDTGYLIGYPIVGRCMVVFREPNGHMMTTTPAKRVFGDPDGQMLYVETENSVYRIEIHGEPIFPMTRPLLGEVAFG